LALLWAEKEVEKERKSAAAAQAEEEDWQSAGAAHISFTCTSKASSMSNTSPGGKILGRYLGDSFEEAFKLEDHEHAERVSKGFGSADDVENSVKTSQIVPYFKAGREQGVYHLRELWQARQYGSENKYGGGGGGGGEEVRGGEDERRVNKRPNDPDLHVIIEDSLQSEGQTHDPPPLNPLTTRTSVRHDANSPYDRLEGMIGRLTSPNGEIDKTSTVSMNLDLRKRIVHKPEGGVSVLGGEGNTRGYSDTRVQSLGLLSKKKVWVRTVTLARSLGGVAYGLMFDITGLASVVVTVHEIVSGSGPQVKAGSEAWVLICQGSHVGKALMPDLWSVVGQGTLVLPRPSFKASEYANYGQLPLQKSFEIYPGSTMGVCIMTSSPEGIVVREGEAYKKPTQPVKSLKEYVCKGPNSSAATHVNGSLRLSVASIISGPNLFVDEPRVFGSFVGGITHSYADV